MTEELSRTEMITQDQFPEVYRQMVREVYEKVLVKTPEIERRLAELLSFSDEELRTVYRELRSVSRWGLYREIGKDFHLRIQKHLGPME